MARGLEVPIFRLFYDGEAPTSLRKLKTPKDVEFGSTSGEAEYPLQTSQAARENES